MPKPTNTTQASNDHRSNQMNPTSSAYKAVNDNRSNQLNPNNSSTKK